MGRIRSIKPDFFRDERIADLSLEAALHFPGLWTIADREGRLCDKPREIAAQIAPLRKVNMEAIIAELAAAQLILRYLVEGRAYIQVVNFVRHQRPNAREALSSLPSPETGTISLSHVQTHAHTELHVQERGEGKGTDKGREWKESRSRRTRVPNDISLTEPLRETARRHRIGDPQREFAKFVAHYQANGIVKADWGKAWLSWCLKAGEFSPPNGNGYREKYQATPVIPSVEETRRMMRAKGLA